MCGIAQPYVSSWPPWAPPAFPKDRRSELHHKWAVVAFFAVLLASVAASLAQVDLWSLGVILFEFVCGSLSAGSMAEASCPSPTVFLGRLFPASMSKLTRAFARSKGCARVGYLPFADELDDPTEVCTAVLKDPLEFPARFKDSAASFRLGEIRESDSQEVRAGESPVQIFFPSMCRTHARMAIIFAPLMATS